MIAATKEVFLQPNSGVFWLQKQSHDLNPANLVLHSWRPDWGQKAPETTRRWSCLQSRPDHHKRRNPFFVSGSVFPGLTLYFQCSSEYFEHRRASNFLSTKDCFRTANNRSSSSDLMLSNHLSFLAKTMLVHHINGVHKVSPGPQTVQRAPAAGQSLRLFTFISQHLPKRLAQNSVQMLMTVYPNNWPCVFLLSALRLSALVFNVCDFSWVTAEPDVNAASSGEMFCSSLGFLGQIYLNLCEKRAVIEMCDGSYRWRQQHTLVACSWRYLRCCTCLSTWKLWTLSDRCQERLLQTLFGPLKSSSVGVYWGLKSQHSSASTALNFISF